MEIDWENFFYECEHDPEINEHPLARNMECMYQAFKARLIEELGCKVACFETHEIIAGELYDKSQEDN